MVKYRCKKAKEEHKKMGAIRYGKPSMTNLPYELGKSIFEEILNSKPVDQEAVERKCQKIEKQIIESRKKETYAK